MMRLEMVKTLRSPLQAAGFRDMTRATRDWGSGASTVSKRGRWSKAEQARLRELYGLRDEAAIARELKRSVTGVHSMAQSLFPQDARKSRPWTASEMQELKRYLGATSAEVIARILGRRAEEVQAQILDLGRIQRGSWERAEIGDFKRIYGTRTDEDLSLIFGRSEEEILRLAREHGLQKDKAFLRKLRGEPSTRMPRWRLDELEVLRKKYSSES